MRLFALKLQPVALLPLLEDAERRTGAKVESFRSVLRERELRAREEG